MAERRKLTAPVMCGRTRLNADQARRQSYEELQHLRAGQTLADHNRTISVHAVDLKHQLRNIQTDRANLAHGRLPSSWFALSAATLGTIDAAEWAPSTASKADIGHHPSDVRFTPESGHHSGHGSCLLCAISDQNALQQRRAIRSPRRLARAPAPAIRC